MGIRLFSACLLSGLISAPLAAVEPPTTAPSPPAMIPPPPGGYYHQPRPGYGAMRPAPGHHYGMAPGAATMPPLPPPFAGVPFTEAQRKAVREMMAKEREAHRKRIALMQQQEARLHELYQADVWDTEAITAAYEAIFAQQRKTIEAMAKARNRIHGMLSAEQRAQMSRLQHQRMERFAPPPQSP